MYFNPPPGWPPLDDPNFTPPPGWSPPRDWPPAPAGWTFWTDEPPMVSQPKRKRRDVFMNHPLWTSVGAVIGIVGLVISGVQIWQSFQAAPEDLEMSIGVIGSPESIAAQQVNRSAGNEVMGTVAYVANPIDITVKNNGGEESTVTQVIAEVKHYELLGDCTASGAGEAGISAEFTIKLPDNPDPSALHAYEQPMTFSVKPGAVERMSITVGPEISTFYNYPYVIGVSLTLVHDDGKTLDAGSYTFVTNHTAVEKNIAESRDATCAQRNLDTLEGIYAFQSIKATELDQLRSAYRTLVASGSGANGSAGSGGAGESTPTTTPRVDDARPVPA